ncbi:hypothetical protein BH18THE2_BH18THE2_38550 [soil metagenome]
MEYSNLLADLGSYCNLGKIECPSAVRKNRRSSKTMISRRTEMTLNAVFDPRGEQIYELVSHHSDSENQAIMIRTSWVCPNCNESNPTRHGCLMTHP